MVAKFVASVRRMPRRMSALICLVVLIPVMALVLRRAEAAPFSNHNWTNLSPSPECFCDGCGCERPSESYQGVSKRTGELKVAFPLVSTPGMLKTHSLWLTWASMNSGTSEFGNRVIPSWEDTVHAVSGTVAEVRFSSGLMATYCVPDRNICQMNA